MSERALLWNVPPTLADHERQFALPVELFGHQGPNDRLPVPDLGIRKSGKQDRIFGYRKSCTQRVGAIVASDAQDAARVWNWWQQCNLVNRCRDCSPAGDGFDFIQRAQSLLQAAEPLADVRADIDDCAIINDTKGCDAIKQIGCELHASCPASRDPAATTVFDSVPMPEISTVTTSPSPRKTGGCFALPTPAGEPVEMMSPGTSGYHCDT